MKKSIYLFTVLLILVGLITACSNDKSTKGLIESETSTESDKTKVTSEVEVELPDVKVQDTEELTIVEKDAYILYSYSYSDAINDPEKFADSILIEKTDAQTTYTFVEHVLSCGTHMNGEIVEVVSGDVKTLTGTFTITDNPYEIDELSLNIIFDANSGKKTGYINVNNKDIDINRF